MILRTFALMALVTTSACATITRGTTESFLVESNPPGAEIKTSNGFKCPATPCNFKMQRKEGFTVTAELEGYLPARETVTSNLAGGGAAGMAGNILVGGIIGIGVDAMSGATQELSPNPLIINLIKVSAPPEQAALPADASSVESPN